MEVKVFKPEDTAVIEKHSGNISEFRVSQIFILGNVAIYAELETPLILVGGNCSVQGYSLEGEEVYWIVTGDNVRSLAAVDIDKDHQDELLVGSDDYDIRIFKEDDLVQEITETQVVTLLYSLGENSKVSDVFKILEF